MSGAPRNAVASGRGPGPRRPRCGRRCAARHGPQHHRATATGAGAGASGPEQDPGLVDQGQVGPGPGDVGQRPAARPEQEVLLGRGEHALGRQRQQGRGAEQVVEELLGAQPGPHPVEGVDHLGQAADLAGEFVQVEATFLVVGVLLRRRRASAPVPFPLPRPWVSAGAEPSASPFPVCRRPPRLLSPLFLLCLARSFSVAGSRGPLRTGPRTPSRGERAMRPFPLPWWSPRAPKPSAPSPISPMSPRSPMSPSSASGPRPGSVGGPARPGAGARCGPGASNSSSSGSGAPRGVMPWTDNVRR